MIDYCILQSIMDKYHTPDNWIWFGVYGRYQLKEDEIKMVIEEYIKIISRDQKIDLIC